MKKGWVLIGMLVMLLLSACGGGGGNNAGGSGSGDGSGAGTPPTANVELIVNRSTSAQGSAMKAMSAPLPPTMARISITNPSVNGISYKQIQDISIPGSADLAVPIASGYTFELVTYVTGSATNIVEEYAVTPNVDIVAGTNTVTLTLNPIGMTYTLPASLTTGQSYSFAAAGTLDPSPFQAMWMLKTQMTNFTKPLHLSGVSYTTVQIDLVAPLNNNQSGTIYYQGEFFLKASMLKAGESYSKWSFVYPNPLWGDPTVSAILSAPSGTVTITL